MIQGKVARVLNARELVINRGAAEGVQLGMRFDVLDPKAENITDPDTNQSLGSVYRPKVRVQVVRVEEHLAVAQTFRTWRENIGGNYNYGRLTDLFTAPKWVVRHETLKTDESTWEDLDESESFVKTGDPVRQVLPTEDKDAEQAVGIDAD